MSTSIMGRACEKKIIQIQTINPRDFTTDSHRTVDDSPYGGGPGMVMRCEPLIKAYRSLEAPGRTLMTSPMGQIFNQPFAKSLTESEQVTMICGHYEGIDARIMDLIPNLELVSLGDFVMTGGELAALAIMDATTRLLPGALGKDESSEEESFSEGLLEYPHYTRPQEFEGLPVPEVLLSGNHAEIAKWRHQQAFENTQKFRPDLLKSN